MNSSEIVLRVTDVSLYYSNKRLDAAANPDHDPDPGILTEFLIGAIVRIFQCKYECKLI